MCDEGCARVAVVVCLPDSIGGAAGELLAQHGDEARIMNEEARRRALWPFCVIENDSHRFDRDGDGASWRRLAGRDRSD